MIKIISFEHFRLHRALLRTHNICYRKQVRVDEIFVHENFTTTGSKANDLALLRLGDKSIENHKLYQTEFVRSFQ